MPASPARPPPAVPDDERARLREFTLFPTEDPFAPEPPTSHQAIDPTRPAVRREEDYFQDRPFYEHDPDAITPLPTSPRGPIPSPWKKPALQIGPDVPSPPHPRNVTATAVKPQPTRQASTRSVASNATFSTPGRDEMERKMGHADEGPFGTAKGVQELAERRRQISGAKSVSQRFEAAGKRGNKEDEERGGLCKCVAM
ncbi:uncharacterized protein N0V89_001308 [Didymosphaeria variabile]|uniref:Uncharacterized protein n=1 Tax=Didymosphaeria variabile TaxID=1932322 RepID=A0A9W9CGP5_9PLEO|nr:uncharacterized protein N0V89_001308 [Didymosphaeria variabile]KAJ4360741.1 hypothetical protein N0V89_001308 [Didymosphaeria variabile]